MGCSWGGLHLTTWIPSYYFAVAGASDAWLCLWTVDKPDAVAARCCSSILVFSDSTMPYQHPEFVARQVVRLFWRSDVASASFFVARHRVCLFWRHDGVSEFVAPPPPPAASSSSLSSSSLSLWPSSPSSVIKFTQHHVAVLLDCVLESWTRPDMSRNKHRWTRLGGCSQGARSGWNAKHQAVKACALNQMLKYLPKVKLWSLDGKSESLGSS